jgi:hypothetical protein
MIQEIMLIINNLSINNNFTAGYLQSTLFNNESSNFYLINITNLFNDSVYLETNRSTYRLLTNFTIGEDIVHYPLYIDFNMTMNLSDNSIENLTSIINVSVYNINNSIQSYFNLTRTQGETGGESYGEYVFKGVDVGSCLNFSWTMSEYDSTSNYTIVCDEHKFTYFYMLYYMGTLSDKIDVLTNSISEYFNNLTTLILGVNNSLYTKLDNLNISGGGGTAEINQSLIDDIGIIKKIQICWFKQYEQIEDYYTYCLDYHNPYNITELEHQENIALNLSAYWLNQSLAQEDKKEFNAENCYNLDKYKSLLNLTDYFVLNLVITAGSISIDNTYCWLKFGFKTLTSVKI